MERLGLALQFLGVAGLIGWYVKTNLGRTPKKSGELRVAWIKFETEPYPEYPDTAEGRIAALEHRVERIEKAMRAERDARDSLRERTDTLGKRMLDTEAHRAKADLIGALSAAAVLAGIALQLAATWTT